MQCLAVLRSGSECGRLLPTGNYWERLQAVGSGTQLFNERIEVPRGSRSSISSNS